MRRLLLLAAVPLLLGAADPRIATLAVPGKPRFVRVARDVVDVVASLDPSLAAGSGLFVDGQRLPSYTPERVAALTTRLDADLATLRKLPWRRWSVDEQIDVRWIYASAELARRQLQDERLYERRPAQWLEPFGNTVVALRSYAADRPELEDPLWAGVPGMLDEMRRVCTKPTRRDVTTGRELALAMAGLADARGATPAAAALRAYEAELAGLTPPSEFAVIGAENYRWRLEHALLLPWDPAHLLANAQADLLAVDARLAGLPPRWTAPEATPEQQARAAALDQQGLLALYDGIEEANRAATVRGGWVTIPPAVGPIRTRPTPEAMIPLTGDGGSMNPPPTFVSDNTGWWNVEHMNPAMSAEERVRTVVVNENWIDNGMGPYSAHEGFPGHHLQLSIARLNPDPLRSILPDPAQNEGWGLYAEEVFHANGGLGSGPMAEASYLRSYRARIGRVVYDVHIETGEWTLQEAADFKYGGAGEVDEDLLRSINWPTQLIAYYSGKAQILALREEYRAKLGPAYSDRAFHDAFLAEGSIPIALIRAKLLGTEVPGF